MRAGAAVRSLTRVVTAGMKRIRRVGRPFAIVVASLATLAIITGARPTYAYQQLQCERGYQPQSAGPSGLYWCQPRPTAAPDSDRPDPVTTQHEIGLYLTNLRIRVLHVDFVSGDFQGFALDVPYSE